MVFFSPYSSLSPWRDHIEGNLSGTLFEKVNYSSFTRFLFLKNCCIQVEHADSKHTYHDCACTGSPLLLPPKSAIWRQWEMGRQQTDPSGSSLTWRLILRSCCPGTLSGKESRLCVLPSASGFPLVNEANSSWNPDTCTLYKRKWLILLEQYYERRVRC